MAQTTSCLRGTPPVEPKPRYSTRPTSRPTQDSRRLSPVCGVLWCIALCLVAAPIAPILCATHLADEVREIGVQVVDCITFGSPPVAIFRMAALAESSTFFKVLNKATLCRWHRQEEYINSFISVYVCSTATLAEKYPAGFSFFNPLRLGVSGTGVVLRDADTDDADSDADEVQVVRCEADLLERKLFGNPLVHLMRVYLGRVTTLAETEYGLKKPLN